MLAFVTVETRFESVAVVSNPQHRPDKQVRTRTKYSGGADRGRRSLCRVSTWLAACTASKSSGWRKTRSWRRWRGRPSGWSVCGWFGWGTTLFGALFNLGSSDGGLDHGREWKMEGGSVGVLYEAKKLLEVRELRRERNEFVLRENLRKIGFSIDSPRARPCPYLPYYYNSRGCSCEGLVNQQKGKGR